MKKGIKETIKRNNCLSWIATLYNWIVGRIDFYKRRLRFHWMTKQMHLVDPAHDKRPKYWKKCGVKTTGRFRVGYGVYFDAINADKITIEDGVWIASECLFLCHRRIIDNYKVGDDYNALSYKIEPITLKKGCCIGMRSIIMPGVTIGEGAIVGIGSLVTKDIPPYSLAVGSPAKVVKTFPDDNEN